MTLANFLTFFRILLIAPLIYMLQKNQFENALIIFIIASLTDFFDGIIARRTRISELGTLLDPIADKLLVTALFIMLIAQNILTHDLVIAAFIIIGREIFVSGLREFIASRPKSKKIPVTQLAKYKTTVQMLAIILIMFNQTSWAPTDLHAISGITLWAAAILSVITAINYVKSARIKI